MVGAIGDSWPVHAQTDASSVLASSAVPWTSRKRVDAGLGPRRAEQLSPPSHLGEDLRGGAERYVDGLHLGNRGRARDQREEAAGGAVDQRTVHGQLLDVVGSVGRELRRFHERGRRLHLDRDLGQDVDAADETLPAHPRLEGSFRGQTGTQRPVERPALVEARLPCWRDGDGRGNGPKEGPAKVDEVRDPDGPLPGLPSHTGRELPLERGVLSDGDGRRPRVGGWGLVRGHGSPMQEGYTTVPLPGEAAIPRARLAEACTTTPVVRSSSGRVSRACTSRFAVGSSASARR